MTKRTQSRLPLAGTADLIGKVAADGPEVRQAHISLDRVTPAIAAAPGFVPVPLPLHALTKKAETKPHGGRSSRLAAGLVFGLTTVATATVVLAAPRALRVAVFAFHSPAARSVAQITAPAPEASSEPTAPASAPMVDVPAQDGKIAGSGAPDPAPDPVPDASVDSVPAVPPPSVVASPSLPVTAPPDAFLPVRPPGLASSLPSELSADGASAPRVVDAKPNPPKGVEDSPVGVVEPPAAVAAPPESASPDQGSGNTAVAAPAPAAQGAVESSRTRPIGPEVPAAPGPLPSPAAAPELPAATAGSVLPAAPIQPPPAAPPTAPTVAAAAPPAAPAPPTTVDVPLPPAPASVAGAEPATAGANVPADEPPKPALATALPGEGALQRAPNASPAPGLLLVARQGDTLQRLYRSVYSGVRPPPFQEVADANPTPVRPGAVLVFPTPPDGWRRP